MDRQGLANERTALAWHRTALAVVAGSAVMARLTLGRLGVSALVLLGAALALGGWIVVESRSRYRHGGERGHRPARGGRAAAMLSLAVVLMAMAELAALTSGEASDDL